MIYDNYAMMLYNIGRCNIGYFINMDYYSIIICYLTYMLHNVLIEPKCGLKGSTCKQSL